MAQRIKLFWKQNCPRCPAAKAAVAESPNVELYNIDEVDGLAEAAFYGILSTPSIIVTDNSGKELISWRGEIPKTQDLEQWL